ncbi:MAG: cytochrome C oxidase subunit IV family protein [Anaerolineales bacterium]|nr:cytochrome C oxidase subunit IV family protein [Anaerolineales bacterium]
MSDKKRAAYRTGIVVFLIVAALTAVEFYLASISGAIAVLFFIALIKAALIVRYFMHVNRLWTDEGHE